MDFSFSEEELAFRSMVRDWVEAKCPKEYALEIERQEDHDGSNFPEQLWQDMAEAGIAEGGEVEIAAQSGRVRTLARGEDRLRRGVVSMTHMYGPLVGTGDVVADGGANLGQLTSLREQLQPINFMPRFSGIPVRVKAG